MQDSKVVLPILNSVSIDQITGLQNTAMQQIKGNLGRNPGDKFTPMGIQDWGTIYSMMDNIAFSFLAKLDMHVFLTALERVEIDQLTQVKSWSVGLMGQAQQLVPAYAYMVARLVRMTRLQPQAMKDLRLTGDAYTVAFFDQLGNFEAKDQYTTGLRYLEAPTVTTILDRIEATGRSEQDTATNTSKEAN